MILNDEQIIIMVKEENTITPFLDHQVKSRGSSSQFDYSPAEKCVSYGLSSFGYDIRVDKDFKIFSPVYQTLVDPKEFNERSFQDVNVVQDGESIIIPPNSFALAKSLEYFRMPQDVVAICLGKSTYARCGIIVNVTPLEPGWEGILTIEISNTSPLPAKVYAGEGIAQLLFFRGSAPPLVNYADRAGKYQGQKKITLPKV